jgi:hypothetical protein
MAALMSSSDDLSGMGRCELGGGGFGKALANREVEKDKCGRLGGGALL